MPCEGQNVSSNAVEWWSHTGYSGMLWRRGRALRLPLCRRHVKDPEVIVRALAGVWQLLDSALTAYSGDATATERLCRLPRYALRTSGAAAAPLLQPLLATLPARFEASGHSSYLYVASEVVKLFGSETGHDAALSALWATHLPAIPCTNPTILPPNNPLPVCLVCNLI